ncbi:hypothetical protein AtNW77_Chr5g0110021 [Arabidopsis thaliana]
MLCKERLAGNACLVDIDLRRLTLGFCGSVSSSEEVSPLSTIVEIDQCECWLILRGTKLGWHYDGLLWP